jgi:hypothetical protein
MEPPANGELVRVTGSGPALDGIVFESPSRTKVIVAVVDPSRGPVFRTVHPEALSARTEEGPADRALRLLIRRTPPTTRGTAGGSATARHASPGHARGTMHRTTGK